MTNPLPDSNGSGCDDKQKVIGNVVLVLENTETGSKRVIQSRNLIMTTGDEYYAQRSAVEAPTNFAYPAMELGTAGNAIAKSNTRADLTAKVTGSLKEIDATYPTTADPDSDNTGAGPGVVTYRVSYELGEANAAAISRVVITNFQGGTPGASEPLLMHASLTPFTKTSSDILKMFVNHTFSGT